MNATVSSKGQITLPKGVRDELGLTAGTPVEFLPQAGGVLLRKRVKGDHPVDRIAGILRLTKTVDQTLKEMRGGRPRRR